MDEMRRVYNRKFPDRIQVVERFVSLLALSVEIVPLANDEIFDVEMAQKIRDRKDLPILVAARSANVEGIITGDKDFLESGIVDPKMISPAEFMKLY